MTSFTLSVMSPVLGLLFVLTTFCINSQALPIYTWVDDQGVPHFSHHPNTLTGTNTLTSTALPYINTAVSLSIKTDRKAKTKNNPTSSKLKKGRTQVQLKNCQRYKEKLGEIQTALRRGYKEPQGNHFREQRRKYSDLVLQHCR